MRVRKMFLAGVIATVLLAPLSAWAQDNEQDEPEQAASARESRYFAADDSWKEKRFHVSAFGGQMLGGTALGLTENLFFRATYNTDSGTLAGGRVGFVFAPRFDVELEIASAQPDLIATLTDLAGRNKTEVAFADLRMTYAMAVVNYSMIERDRRLVPILSLGLGMVRADSDAEEIVSATEMGIIFGAGIRFRITDMFVFRTDARGLRSGFGTKQIEGDLPGVFVGDYKASNFLWSFGLDVRF